MKFDRVWFRNFRNLKDQSIDVSYKQVFLIGENGQGKTNMLEVLYFLCYGNSFRTRNLREVTRHGSDDFLIGAEFHDVHEDSREIILKYVEGKKTVLLDGREIKDRREVIYNIPCVNFSYDDIDLIRGEPEFRRNFFDQSLSMYDPLYLDDLRHYKAVLKQRNAAVKTNMKQMMETYNLLLARYGLRIQKARNEACSVLNMIFPDFYKNIAEDGRNLTLSYRPSWDGLDSEEKIAEYLGENWERDQRMFSTTSGIHRDRFIIYDQNGLFQNSGSTGQLRLASLILRTAQAAFFRRQTGMNPVMLIDDVMLELDSRRRGAFLEQLGSYSQAFFTFLLDEKYFSGDSDESSKCYHVINGQFEAQR
ncbi:MAG: DNA replication and repair protein RecF [Sphaerochaetaceae bacterium]|jgi:DNA replication and repair protein RecF|nr:DNA replication and repair protein RecF [Sphaerochaetaceae bacterium]NLY07716.1 DNA replication/repair protein RecF [Spirochaetales bacterium]